MSKRGGKKWLLEQIRSELHELRFELKRKADDKGGYTQALREVLELLEWLDSVDMINYCQLKTKVEAMIKKALDID